MNLLTIYWKREPTTDEVAKKYLTPKQLKRCKDTVFYKDRHATQFYARLPWDYKGHPTKRTQTRILNCYKFQLERIEEVES